MRPRLAIALGLLLLPTSIVAEEPTPKGAAAILTAHDKAVMRDLEQYLRKNPKAEDRDEAYSAIFDRAIDHDWFAEVEPLAKQYLADHPEGAARPMARIVATMARARAGKFGEALAVYKDLMKGLDRPDQEEFAVNFADNLAGAAITAGESTVAREVYETLLGRFPDRPELKEKVGLDLARLERIGKAAPKLLAADVFGKDIKPADLKGKYVLVDFWATWCAPCLNELPNLQAAYAKNHLKGFEVVAVSLDDKAEDVTAFVKDHKLPWRVLHNATAGKDLVEAFGVANIPASFLIDPEGKIIRLDLKGPALGQALEGLLKAAK